MSGGFAASFLAFLGATFREPEILHRIGSDAATSFVGAMRFFVWSILLCLCAHGSTFISHAAYHSSKPKLGDVLMVITVLLMAGVVVALARGSFSAFAGLSLGLDRLRVGG